MNLRLRNTWKYKGYQEWDWSIFLEDDGTGEIENVLFVEYILHPTFPNPMKIKTNKDRKFILHTSGWGAFEVKAFVHTVQGEKIKLIHHLSLERNPNEGETK